MRFWDSSAIVPLLVGEAMTPPMQALAREDPVMLVWWATEVECVSALSSLERQDDLVADAAEVALGRLDTLADGWHEVQPGRALCRTARRLLRVHDLRAADALQLAAGIAAAEGEPASLDLVTLDERLAEVARREGFVVRGDAD